MDPETKNSQASEYATMMNMLHEAKENYEMYKGIIENTLKTDDISFGRSCFLFDAFSADEIKEMDDSLAEEMILKIRIPEKPRVLTEEEMKKKEEGESVIEDYRISDDEWIREICKNQYSTNKQKENDKTKEMMELSEEDVLSKSAEEEEEELDFTEFENSYDELKYGLIRDYLLSIKKDIASFKESEKDVESLQKEADEVTKKYMDYMKSDEYMENQKTKIKNMEEKIKSVEDTDPLKRKMMKELEELKMMRNLSFLTERLEKLGIKEVENIVNCYFNSNRSSYVIKRYKEKIKKLGFDEKTYRVFFNLEQDYLPEEYHVFNNLFLFIVMRFIGQIDPYNEAKTSYGRAILSNMSRMCYSQFSEIQKEEFINFMKKTLDYFMPYYDKFEKDNILHPKHPVRIEKEKENDKKEREMIYNVLEINNIDITEEIKTMPLDELEKFYKKKLEEIEEEKANEKVEDLKAFIESIKKEETDSQNTEN